MVEAARKVRGFVRQAQGMARQFADEAKSILDGPSIRGPLQDTKRTLDSASLLGPVEEVKAGLDQGTLRDSPLSRADERDTEAAGVGAGHSLWPNDGVEEVDRQGREQNGRDGSRS